MSLDYGSCTEDLPRGSVGMTWSLVLLALLARVELESLVTLCGILRWNGDRRRRRQRRRIKCRSIGMGEGKWSRRTLEGLTVLNCAQRDLYRKDEDERKCCCVELIMYRAGV